MRKKPMLAHPVGGFERIKDDDWPLYSQPKLDGVRCLIQYEPMRNRIVAYSRTGKEWKNIYHILKELRSFFYKFPNIILDGELYNHDLKNDFEKIISLVRKTKPMYHDRVESDMKVQFHCYDTIMEHMPFDERDHFIAKNLQTNYCIKHVRTLLTNNKAHTKACHKENLVAGYEGSIVRTNDIYQCKRSHSLRKFKDFQDAEALIIGYEEGKGKREGTLGKFLMQDEDGNKFGCPPGKGYNYQDMRDMLKDIHKYMGQLATFTYFERTKAGSYRHPLFKSIRNYE